MLDHDRDSDIALVKDGLVVQVAFAPDATPAAFGPEPDGELIDFAPGAAVPGKLWDGENLTAPEPEPTVPGIPQSVSMRQARLALLGAGLLDPVETLISGQPRAVQIEWEFATDVWRHRDLVQTLGSALSLTEDQIDALFVAAKAIP